MLERLVKDRGFYALLTGLTLLVIFLAVQPPGIDWGDDWAMYISHARNLASGHDYFDIGYLFHSSTAEISPTSCPPVFPAYLSFVVRWKGFDLEALKAATVVTFAIAGALVVFYFSPLIGNGWAVLVALAFAASRIAMDASHTVTPHGLAIIWLFAFLLFERHARKKGWTESRPWMVAALLLGLALFGAFTRVAGVAIAAAFVVHDAWVSRRIRKINIAFAIGFAVLFVLLSKAFPGGASYGKQLHIQPGVYAANLGFYLRMMSYMFLSPLGLTIRTLLFLGSIPLAAWGVVRRLRNGPGLGEWFILAHLGMLTMYTGGQNPAYLLPIVPFYFSYIAEGAVGLGSGRQAWTIALRYATCIALLVAPLANIANAAKRAPITDGPFRPGFQELVEEIRRVTPPDATIASAKPRLLTLLTGRRAGFCVRTQSSAEFMDNLSVRGIQYLVLNRVGEDDWDWILPHLTTEGDRLETVWSNSETVLYRTRFGPMLAPM